VHSRQQCDIVQITKYAEYKAEKVPVYIFMDLTDSSITLDILVNKIKKLNCVLNCWYSGPVKGGPLVDEFGFPMWMAGRRHISFSTEGFVKMLNDIAKVFGSAAEALFTEMGIKAGESKITRIERDYNLKGMEAIKLALAERLSKGWGIVELFEEKEEKWRIRVSELFECILVGTSKKPSSIFFKGYLTGLFRRGLGKKELVVSEAKCVSMGEKCCEFEITLNRKTMET